MNEYIKKLGRIFKYLDKETIIKIERKYHNEAEMHGGYADALPVYLLRRILLYSLP